MPSTFATTLAAAKKYILNIRLLRGLSKPECLLERLTDDILVDGVFSYLDIEDILCLRRVSGFTTSGGFRKLTVGQTNVLFFTLTAEPVVWKRILRRLHLRRIPVPVLPPTPRYAVEALKEHEVEQLILRALSIDKNWRSTRPALQSVHSSAPPAGDEHAACVEMVILPGGHYVITCERRPDEETQVPCFSINVYSMDDERRLVMKLGMLQLQKGRDRAFNLQARYMTINGEKSIVVGWGIRDYKHLEHATFTPFE